MPPNRKLIWENGKRLSIDASVRRTHREYSDFPLDLIETHLIRWLERELAPRELFQQMDELDRLTMAWIDDYNGQRKV